MMLSAIVFALLASGQVALALPAVSHSNPHHLADHAQHASAHHRLARSFNVAPRRRSALAKHCPTSNATETANERRRPSEATSGVDQPAEIISSEKPSETPSESTGSIEERAKSDSDESNRAPVLGKSLLALFPASTSSSLRTSSWSTRKGAPNTIAFTDSALGATNIMKLSHQVETAPDGSEAMEVSFKKGAYAFRGPKGGFSFVAYGPDSVPLTKAKEATFAYSVYFQEGFQFNRGGKLPGLMGGDSDAAAKRCNGGHKANDCFSARMMFRADGRGELYAYLPPDLKGNKAVCDKVPQSHFNPAYGSSLGRGLYKYKTGGWTTMAQRVRLNDPGKANGEIEIFINGESVIKATGITLRRDGSGRIRSALIQSFFGGHEPLWGSPRDQKMWFKDFTLAITEEL